MKKIASFLLAAALCVSVSAVAAQEEKITVLLDGEAIVFDQEPELVNDRTMVPMRMIFEALNCDVTWEPEYERVEAITPDSDIILLYVGENYAYKNEERISIDAAPYLKGDRTMVPLRFISEASGAKVEWDGETSTVDITSPDKLMDYIPFGEYLTIPSPSTVNGKVNIVEYRKEGDVSYFTYDINQLGMDKVAEYEELLSQFNFEKTQESEDGSEKLFFNGSLVLKTTVEAGEGEGLYHIELYADSTGGSLSEE